MDQYTLDDNMGTPFDGTLPAKNTLPAIPPPRIKAGDQDEKRPWKRLPSSPRNDAGPQPDTAGSVPRIFSHILKRWFLKHPLPAFARGIRRQHAIDRESIWVTAAAVKSPKFGDSREEEGLRGFWGVAEAPRKTGRSGRMDKSAFWNTTPACDLTDTTRCWVTLAENPSGLHPL